MDPIILILYSENYPAINKPSYLSPSGDNI